jgi:hypothetical protein
MGEILELNPSESDLLLDRLLPDVSAPSPQPLKWIVLKVISPHENIPLNLLTVLQFFKEKSICVKGMFCKESQSHAYFFEVLHNRSLDDFMLALFESRQKAKMKTNNNSILMLCRGKFSVLLADSLVHLFVIQGAIIGRAMAADASTDSSGSLKKVSLVSNITSTQEDSTQTLVNTIQTLNALWPPNSESNISALLAIALVPNAEKSLRLHFTALLKDIRGGLMRHLESVFGLLERSGSFPLIASSSLLNDSVRKYSSDLLPYTADLSRGDLLSGIVREMLCLDTFPKTMSQGKATHVINNINIGTVNINLPLNNSKMDEKKFSKGQPTRSIFKRLGPPHASTSTIKPIVRTVPAASKPILKRPQFKPTKHVQFPPEPKLKSVIVIPNTRNRSSNFSPFHMN